jgi:hypothetical protein
LVPGTEAYNNKIIEINNATSELLKKYPTLSVMGSSSLYIELDEGKYEELLKEV